MAEHLIHGAIIDVMRDVQPILKTRRNEQQKYNFRGVDDVYNALHPLLAKHGVYSTSEVLDAKHDTSTTGKGTTLCRSVLRMRYTYWAADGSNVSTEVVGEGIDYGGDKASNKAMSAADKYALLQLLKVPTACVDSDAEPLPTPDADANAPNVPPRGATVTKEDVASLTTLYKSKHPDHTKADFETWVQGAVQREFDVGSLSQWHRDDLAECLKQLGSKS